MKQQSIKKNFLYNVAYQLLVHILPFITIPYVSRVLGAEKLGTYSYTYSIVYYFMIFAMLGLANYGNRTIAKARDNRKILSRTFKEIYYMQLISSLTMLVLYVGYLLVINESSSWTISIAQILYLLSCVFDISWFFFGLERFKLTVTWNMSIKVTALILIFLFVKGPEDLWVYTTILGGSTLVTQLALWPFVPKCIDNVKIRLGDIRKHIVPNLRLFLTVIGVTIFKVMDKTMIGMFSNMSEVGYYENAEKITQAPVTIISALGTVMLPRMSNMFRKSGDENKAGKVIRISMKVAMMFACALAFGLAAVGKDFAVVFFGVEFEKAGTLVAMLAVTIVFLAWGNVIRTQYLIPKEYDKEYAVSAFVGAGINLVVNLALIPNLGAIGACIGTILAEFSVAFYQTAVVKEKLPIRLYLKDSMQFILRAICMYIAIVLVGLLMKDVSIVVKVIAQVIVGVIVYTLASYKFIRKELMNFERHGDIWN